MVQSKDKILLKYYNQNYAKFLLHNSVNCRHKIFISWAFILKSEDKVFLFLHFCGTDLMV